MPIQRCVLRSDYNNPNILLGLSGDKVGEIEQSSQLQQSYILKGGDISRFSIHGNLIKLMARSRRRPG